MCGISDILIRKCLLIEKDLHLISKSLEGIEKEIREMGPSCEGSSDIKDENAI